MRDSLQHEVRNEESCSLVNPHCSDAVCCCSIAEAQQPKTVPRIGYLSALEPARESTRSEAIRLALRELGYIERQNIAISTDMRPGN
ncbi:MAG TPA: hypothetical protein VFP47_02700 [Pyrinomonadaceae bacterium]|nr:hypothetical protein [Pyrinomonadaceae bacterium]